MSLGVQIEEDITKFKKYKAVLKNYRKNPKKLRAGG
jgi:hypothetical protein